MCLRTAAVWEENDVDLGMLWAKNYCNITAALPSIFFALRRLLTSWLAAAALVLRFLATSTCFKLHSPSICQPLNVPIACSLTICVRRARRVPLRWPAPGTCLTCLDGARSRPARMWCVPVLPSPPARAYTMLWLGAVSCSKLRGAGGVCAGLPCSRRP